MTATNAEFVVYRGRRSVGAGSRQAWPRVRRERYLLRTDVRLPISVDRAVLPEADAEASGCIDVVATVVPTVGSEEGTSRWRGSEIYGDLPTTPEWRRLGFDVCDATGTSGLMNCGYEVEERHLVDDFVERVNDYHLLETAEAADEFRRVCDRRVPEHAPFALLAVYVRVSHLRLLG